MNDENVKNDGPAPRARKENISAYLAKVHKKAAQIADLMTDKDIAADLRVLRAAKRATHHVYDTEKKKLVKVPDHKTRLAATTLSRAYHEGKPIERQVSVSGNFKDFNEVIEKVKSSPAMMAALSPMKSLQNTAQGEESAGKDAPAAGEETENPPGQKFTLV